MNILVTGAAGFIGSHVCEHVLRGCQPHDVVVALDDLSGGLRENVPSAARFIAGSVTDYPLLEKMFAEYRFDHVYHLAAYAAEGLSHFIRRFNYENNLVGSVNLINLSVLHGVKCFVFTSSIAVYGVNQVPMTEDLAPRPEDPYGISKYAVELDLEAAHRMFGLPYVIFRPHNVYGRRQNMADKYRNVIGIFMNQIMRDQPMTIFGDGAQMRAFTHIDDVAPYIAASAGMPSVYNEVFNVGASQYTTVSDLAVLTAKAFDKPVRVSHLPERNEVKVAYADHAKLGKFFRVRPERPLAAGLRDMAEWARTMPAQEPSEFGAIEVPINLPPSWKAATAGRDATGA